MGKKCLRWILLILVAAMLSACRLLPEEETLPPMPVIYDYEVQAYDYVTVMRGDLVTSETVRVTYVLTQTQHLSFPVEGLYIDTVSVTEGQQVKKGDLLATLELESLQPQLTAQRYEVNVLYKEKKHLGQTLELELAGYDAMLRSVERELQQLQTDVPEEDVSAVREKIDALLQQKGALERDRAAAQSNYDAKADALDASLYVASLRLQELESALAGRQLIAGIDGVVTYLRDVEEGQRSVKDQRFITISDLASAAFTAEAKYADYFPVGTDVVISCNGKEYEATVAEATEPEASVYFQLKQPDPSLSENARGIITVTLEQRTDVLYVQEKAIRTVNGETFVYLLNEDGLRTMRSVTTGLETGKFVEILAGLDEGDRVIAD